MAITRKYETERECAQLFVNESFDNIPSWLITEQPDFYEEWEFYGIDEDSGELEYCDVPMWGTWFMVDDWFEDRFINEHEREVAELGFTIIKHEGELFALGVDGAGYDFYEAHWIPLYRLNGFTWHE